MGRGPTRDYYQSMHDDYVEGSLTCLKQEVITERINTAFPLVLNIEPTNDCNLQCTYCPRQTAVRHNGLHYLSLEVFYKIIDEAAEYDQLIMLNLHKDGESLLHHELPEMISYAKKKNVAKTIHLNTNGTLLCTDVGEKILESGIDDITVSVDAAFPETYYKAKRSRGFYRLMKGIESFIACRDKMHAHTVIRVKIMEYEMITQDEIQAFYQRWDGVADQVQVTGVHNWSGAIDGLNITDETSPERYPCALLWYALAVNSSGRVSICNVDWNYSGVVGNIHKKCLHEIWNDLPIKKIRRAHLLSRWNYVPVCDQCVVWVSVGDLKSYFIQRQEFL